MFFSHGKEDTYMVQELFAPKLKASGANVFIDAGAIQYGDDFRRLILTELAQADELLVFLSPSALSRPWVFAEIGGMLVRGKRIVAIIYASETTLQELGILSLLGTTSMLRMEDFDSYVVQLTARVEASS